MWTEAFNWESSQSMEISSIKAMDQL